MLKNKNIVIISNQSYHDRYWTSKQYITQELIKENRVLYIDGNYSFGKMAKAIIGEKWPITFWGKLKKINDKLFVFTPPPRLPLRNHFRFISKIHQYILLRSIKKVIRKIGIMKPVVWSFLHSTNDLVGKLDESLFIYHCVDDWGKRLPMAGMGRIEQVEADEFDVAKKSDICFATAKVLAEKLVPHQAMTFHVPNGVDFDLFHKSVHGDLKKPLDIATVRQPLIMFIGNLENWVNYGWLYDIFKQKSEWSFVAIGMFSKDPEIEEINSLPNVHLLGLKPKESLPAYLKYADVTLIPYAITELGKTFSPLKLFEYMAAGKPVVAADLPEITPFSPPVYTGSTSGDFITNIEKALKIKNNNKHIQSYIDLARQNSWAERVKSYTKHLNKLT